MGIFSERIGVTKGKAIIQMNSMDDDLRNGIWNVLTICYLESFRKESSNLGLSYYPEANRLFRTLWEKYYKQPLDTIPRQYLEAEALIRKLFFSSSWYEVYDLVEFIANNFQHRYIRPDFIKHSNMVFERELSGYRFIGSQIVPINSEEEVMEIEEALHQPLSTVTKHLTRAIELFSDRGNPDFRNSIKESISAVEALCYIISGENTLGKALNHIEKQGKIELHGALKQAFSNLYGYTNDSDGIRHALSGETIVGFEDAKFMLVSCSAFINYLIVKTDKAGIIS